MLRSLAKPFSRCTFSRDQTLQAPSYRQHSLRLPNQASVLEMRDVCVHAAKGKGSPGGKKGSPKTSLLSGLLKKKAIAEAEPEEDSLGDDRARPEQ